MKLFFILIVVTYELAFAQETCDNPKEPMKILKYADVGNNDPIEQFIKNQMKYICPAENLNMVPKEYLYELSLCLFDKPSNTYDETECKVEVNPTFTVYLEENNKPKRCGSDTRHLYKIGYNYCGDVKILEKFENEENPAAALGNFIIPLRIYDLCYDIEEKRTVWTRHTIQHPGLFETFVDQREEYCPKDISTDPFFLDADVFNELKREYEEKNKKKMMEGHKMVPQRLVPLEHLALRMWKKTANHYINTAPLRKNLVPLMTAIDEGIRRAAQKIYFQDDKKINDFVIFTKVKTETSVASWFKKLFRMKVSESNIWYKVVYSFTTQKVLTIIIHNTSEKPKKKKCQEVICNFLEWTEDKKVKKGISRDKQKHAYCCKLKAKEINDIFSFNLPSNGLLDINTMITKK